MFTPWSLAAAFHSMEAAGIKLEQKHRRRKEPYLTDNIELGKRFGKVFIQGLMRLHRTGELKLDGQWSQLKETAALESWLRRLLRRLERVH